MRFAYQHILICRTDNIGDVVLTLPIAAYLKREYPGIKIGFLCRRYAAPLVRGCKAIDYVIEAEQPDVSTLLATSGIDTIIFSKPDRRLAAAAKKARIPHRIGTSHKWFHWIYCNRLAHFSRVKSSYHEAQLNFELLRPLGFNVIPSLTEIPALYQLTPPPFGEHLTLPPDQFHVILHPKSNGNGREWSIEHFTELARLLQDHDDIRLWITGSAGEQAWLATHAADLLKMPNVTSVCGKFALDELAGFINAANGLIASGTGPLHMSAALGKPTLGLFPPVKPIHPGRWGPVGAKAQVLCQDSPCTGCKDASTCSCMRNITPAQVSEVILQWQRESKA